MGPVQPVQRYYDSYYDYYDSSSEDIDYTSSAEERMEEEYDRIMEYGYVNGFIDHNGDPIINSFSTTPDQYGLFEPEHPPAPNDGHNSEFILLVK